MEFEALGGPAPLGVLAMEFDGEGEGEGEGVLMLEEKGGPQRQTVNISPKIFQEVKGLFRGGKGSVEVVLPVLVVKFKGVCEGLMSQSRGYQGFTFCDAIAEALKQVEGGLKPA
jgi:hypothetical protein